MTFQDLTPFLCDPVFVLDARPDPVFGWQNFTGKQAILKSTGEPFQE